VSEKTLGGLLGGECLDAGVQAALVAGGGIGVEDALLHALVERRGGRLVLLAGGLEITLVERLTQQAEAAADAALVRTVDRSAPFSLTDALERGDVVCYGVTLSSFLEYGMQAMSHPLQ